MPAAALEFDSGLKVKHGVCRGERSVMVPMVGVRKKNIFFPMKLIIRLKTVYQFKVSRLLLL